MLAGHVGAALIAKRFEPRLNLGLLLLAVLFAVLLLWVLVALGVESVSMPSPGVGARFFTFHFPWSHGLAASIAWTVLAWITLRWSLGRGIRRPAALTAVGLYLPGELRPRRCSAPPPSGCSLRSSCWGSTQSAAWVSCPSMPAAADRGLVARTGLHP